MITTIPTTVVPVLKLAFAHWLYQLVKLLPKWHSNEGVLGIIYLKGIIQLVPTAILMYLEKKVK